MEAKTNAIDIVRFMRTKYQIYLLTKDIRNLKNNIITTKYPELKSLNAEQRTTTLLQKMIDERIAKDNEDNSVS